MIRLGYVGVNTLLPSASNTFRIANYTEERMLETARMNLKALKNILDWNAQNGVFVFRITSQLIPYGSSLINSNVWQEIFFNEFKTIGKFIRDNGMRVSMHPGQYTVLNTPDKSFYINGLRDLVYHNSILDLMELDSSNKIIIHGGGAYGDKRRSLKILETRIQDLPREITNRLALENDERVYNAEDIAKFCNKTGLPGVFDIFHHQILPSFESYSNRKIVFLFMQNWINVRQKIHYSNQQHGKRRGAHSESIDMRDFAILYEEIKDLDLDLMLEVKDKQESLFKLRNNFPELQ